MDSSSGNDGKKRGATWSEHQKPLDIEIRADVLRDCQQGLTDWRGLGVDDFDFAPPKGFSTFTMAVRARVPTTPEAVLYRRLEGKENAILEADAERGVFLALSDANIAAPCHLYTDRFRLEGFYEGRTLTADEVFDPGILRKIAAELHRFHGLQPPCLPAGSFFELLHDRWGPMAKHVLEECRHEFPEDERELCEPLSELYSETTRREVARRIPDGPLTFCHNDTYHGNVMRLADGHVRLLDFEFSCLNHRAFDFANLFAETVMEHGLPEPPYFRIGQARFSDETIRCLVSAYLAHDGFPSLTEREAETDKLVSETRDMIAMSDYMYAMAALPLALNPIQKIRFLPYAHQRFQRFLSS